MSLKNVLIGCGIIGLTVFSYYLFSSSCIVCVEKKTKKSIKDIAKVVDAQEVNLQDIKQTARLIGTYKPKHSTVLIAKAPGTLDTFAVSGQFVKKGTLIAKIENADIEKNYQLSLDSEKISKERYERSLALQKSGSSSKAMADIKKNELLDAQKRLALAKIELEKIRFEAPFDGVVGVFKVREGTQVQASDQIVSFYDPTSTIVEFDIPANLVEFIKEGQAVNINNKEYKLTHFQKMVDEDTHMCPAYLDIDCDNCIIGTTVDVDITLVEKKSVIVVPYESVFIKEGKTFVYLIKNNKTVLTPVTLGIREKDKVEITSNVQKGDIIITKGQHRLYPDIQVVINKPQ